MSGYLGIMGMVIVATLSPGPNNLIVLGAVNRGGVAAVKPLASGILAGSLALLVAAWLGTSMITAEVPIIRTILAYGGAAYLTWLALDMIRTAGSEAVQGAQPSPRARSFLGMAGFQFLNPKAWVLMLTVVAAYGQSAADLLVLALTVVACSFISLALWVGFGVLVAGWLSGGRASAWFERALGLLLLASAVLLVGAEWNRHGLWGSTP